MPLSDLEPLGYEIDEAVGHPDELVVTGHRKHWLVQPGTEDEVIRQATNHAALEGKLEQAQDYFSTNYRDWGTLTAPQKDAAARNAQRALANLIRTVRDDLADEGV